MHGPGSILNKAPDFLHSSLDHQEEGGLFWEVLLSMGDGTKHSSRDLSQVGFQMPGLPITVYTSSSYSVYPASFIFQMVPKHSANQKLVSA